MDNAYVNPDGNPTRIYINECRETSPCGDNIGVECVNRPGSYECRCKDGFEGDPRKGCSDVNECLMGTQHCGPHAKCINAIGGYECECLPGFERITEGAGCTDIDECFLSVCHPAASCANLVGSFSCSCPDGFVGDGMQCHETILYPIANDSIVVPRKADALATIDLPSPVFVFGKPYERVYMKRKYKRLQMSRESVAAKANTMKKDGTPGISGRPRPAISRLNHSTLSSNGVLSFDRPLPGIIERAETLREAAIFALHVQYDYAREGLVAYTYINESDTSAYSLLSRSSTGVQNNFRLRNFQTKTLHLFTFDRMRQAGSENLNSFQIVLAQSNEATMLTLIYEKTQSKGPMTGIASPTSSFHLLPNDMLSSHSNVGQPGKWMYRIDNGISTCPAGTEHPPLCDKVKGHAVANKEFGILLLATLSALRRTPLNSIRHEYDREAGCGGAGVAVTGYIAVAVAAPVSGVPGEAVRGGTVVDITGCFPALFMAAAPTSGVAREY
ncbi:calcium binding EGF domain protein [Teladorsagia circumcincta]|uniref:Calcium binding EGF domain protein n=1 Tax=Teladorsagia circumcincta TaxID=45464 RepID=A0A2G9TZU0_TELCI|nr:calcium binding EGF domain protein [Teladorsagia circumcincta]